MIWWISGVGVFFLLVLRIWSVWMDRPAQEVKKHFKKEMIRAAVEFLAILLSVTIGINFDEWQQNKQQKEQIMALLEVSVGEINSSVSLNEFFLRPYENLEEGQTVSETAAGVLKSNAACKVASIEKILDMESVMVTLSPGAYNVMCNCIENAQKAFAYLQTLDYKTEANEIGTVTQSVNVHLQMLMSIIELEQRCLEGELSPEQVMIEYGDLWFDVNPYVD